MIMNSAPSEFSALSGPEFASYRPVIQRSIWFASLPPVAAQHLLDNATLRHLAARQQLFLRGDRFDGIYCVLSGEIRATGITLDGQENMFNIIMPPMWFGEIAMFDDLSRTHDTHAVEPTVLLYLSRSCLSNMLAEDPQWGFRIGMLLAQKMRAAFIALEMQSHLNTQARLAGYIAIMATQAWTVSPAHYRADLQLNQGTIAESLSVTRQTVAQGLKRLAEQGIVKLGYRRIMVLDWKRLCALAKVDPAYPHPAAGT